MSTKRETVEEKGWRMFASGAVDKVCESLFEVRGDNGRYRVESGRCSCPSFSRCSHEEAVDLACGIASPPEGKVEVEAEILAALVQLELEVGARDGDSFEALRTLRTVRRAASGEADEKLEGLFA